MVVGKLVVAEEVFVDITMAALLKVEDVIRQERKGALSGLGRLFSGRLSSEIKVQKSEIDEEGAEAPGEVSFDLKLTVAYGVNIPEAAKKVRDAVAKDIHSITGYKVDKVDITVERMVRPEELEAEAQEEE